MTNFNSQRALVIDVTSCKICYKVVSCERVLKRHMRVVHNQPPQRPPSPDFPKRFMCTQSECWKEFHFRHELNHHRKIAHEENVLEQCAHCKKQFKNSVLFKRHMLVHSEKEFDCDECPKKFSRKDLLKRHEKTVHLWDTSYNMKAMLKDAQFMNGYKCDRCGKFLLKSEQMIRHHDEKKCINECDICGKTFKEKRFLMTHKMAHDGPSKFTCNLCEKSFSYKSGLQKHIRNVHRDR